MDNEPIYLVRCIIQKRWRSTHTHTLIIHDALAMMDVVADNPDDIDMEQIELEAHDLLFLDDGEMNVTHIPN